MDRIFSKISSTYFFVVFGAILYDKVVNFSQGLIWIPVLHLALFVLVQIFDNKAVKMKLDYPKYSGMKVYELWDKNAALLQ